jgi:hypothetical protein
VIVQTTKNSGDIVVTASSSGLSSGSVTVSTTGGTPPIPRSAFTQIEAESYNNQSGVQTETCSEGGEDVAYIENGDYVVYNKIDFGSGAKSFEARVASAGSGGSIEVWLDSLTGTLVGTCPVAVTGDWQTWADATCSVGGVSGTHDLYLKFIGDSGYLFNLNWWKFNPEGNPTILMGDLNDDKAVNSVDFMTLQQYLLGKITAFPDPNGETTGDVNGDKTINSMDYTLFKRYLLGIITEFPYHPEMQLTFYVSPTGSDSDPGTLEQPFQTITKARDVVRTVNTAKDIHVYLRGGVYNLAGTITFGPQDSGTNGYRIYYQAYQFMDYHLLKQFLLGKFDKFPYQV